MKLERFSQKPITTQAAQAADAIQSQAPEKPEAQVGLGPIGPVICPMPPAAGKLGPEELEQIAKPGAKGMKGHGTLEGELKIATRGRTPKQGGIGVMEDIAFLVTSGKGTRSEVSFQLDLDPRKAGLKAGARVAIEGLIEKTSMYAGKITGAKLGEIEGVKSGSYARVSGTVENRTGMVGIGGEVPPEGAYLRLDKPMTIDGKTVKELHLGYREYADGAKLELNGRLDAKTWGGVETPLSTYFLLSGISDLGKGEPIYDGNEFTSSKTGKPLERLSYNRPMMYDAPGRLFVLDQGTDTAFIGSFGGHIPPGMNPFHGFHRASKIEDPTAADRAAIGTNAEGIPFVKATGKELEIIATEETPPGMADGMGSSWAYDAEAQTLYKFLNGGIAGFQNYMSQIVRGPATEE